MKTKNETPVFVDYDRLAIGKSELKQYCAIANEILTDLQNLEVKAPDNLEQAIELLYAGSDRIVQIIRENQLAKMTTLPAAAAEKLLSYPVDSLNRLNQKSFSLQNRYSTSKISPVDYILFADGQIQFDPEKLERSMTVYRTETITEAEQLAEQLINSMKILKEYCTDKGYPGKIIEFDSFLNWNESEQSFELNPIGFQYFK